MGRAPCCDKMGLKKGPWTPDEDRKLLAYIHQHGHGNWHAIPSKAGLKRCGKSCRLRWANYLRPDIKRGKFSLQEDEIIIQLHSLLGNRWSTIAAHLPNRTDNEIKNYWNTHLKKRLTNMGIDPVTHKPKPKSPTPGSSSYAHISHMAQWESARLEAEARSKFDSSLNPNYNYSSLDKTTFVPPSCMDMLKAWAWTNPGKDIYTPMLLNENLSSITNTCHVDDRIYHRDDDLGKGIMGSSLEFHDRQCHVPNPSFSALGFQSFVEGITNVSNGPSDDIK
ncbi:hypothetical protein CASFOL_020774 [Castilleja foliolosa]|uniref:Uncharacterized protein n=1 Tax=Castilleja foliolosa TaxID=1961234 RepID=A0ABD3D646_9LAMI